MIHPEQALFESGVQLPLVAPCDHYAGTERFMRKALALQQELDGRFDVTLDLEDGAPAGSERQHADLVVELLNAREHAGARAGVRIHDGSHPAWRQDVDRVVAGACRRIAHVTIPKVASARQATDMIRYVHRACDDTRLERSIPIHVLIETHGALRDVHEIAALPWVRGLDFGLMDFVSAHRGAIGAEAMRSPGQFEHALVRHAKTVVAVAAHGAGLVPAHNVTVDLDDPEQAGRDARRARDELGYLRMWSIHPSQIEPILAAFTPDAAELELAAAVLLAGGRRDWAPVEHEGRLHDRASYRYCWHVLQRGRSSGARLPDEAAQAFFAEGA